MPTMSSLRSKPAFTPLTMLATSARAVPWSARVCRSSPPRVRTSVLFSSLALSPSGRDWESLPLGPSALTRPFSIWTFTPWGIATGCFPMRDMVSLSPHVGEDFAAHLLLARLAVGHDTPGRGHDRHAHAAEDGRDRVVTDVDPPSRRGHAHQPRDHLLVGRAVFQIDAERALLLVLEHAEVLDEALALEDLGEAQLDSGRRDVHLLVLGPAGVADAGQEVGDGIASHGRSEEHTSELQSHSDLVCRLLLVKEKDA